jgi:hypothetical protein
MSKVTLKIKDSNIRKAYIEENRMRIVITLICLCLFRIARIAYGTIFWEIMDTSNKNRMIFVYSGWVLLCF